MANPDLAPGALAKPLRGAYTLARRTQEAEHKRREQRVMAGVKAEDRKCRVPRCGYTRARVEVAHKDHRGMGGNPAEDRTVPEDLITLCSIHHGLWDRGDPKLGELQIEPLDPVRRFRGPCAYYLRHLETGRRECVGVESKIGISETRGL